MDAGKLSVSLPKDEFSNGQLVLEADKLNRESQALERVQIQLATFDRGDLSGSKGLSFKVPAKHFSSNTFNVEFLGEGSLEELGKVEVVVIMKTGTEDYVVHRNVMELTNPIFELPPLLPGDYLIEVIPENNQMQAAIENISRDETAVAFSKEPQNSNPAVFFQDFIDDNTLTERGKYKIERSARFLPALLS